jgi:hypothetical protein
LALLPVASLAGGGSALTYIMPPGGEGPASVALGVAVPGGLPSMEVNPALLAWEGARTSSTLQFSSTTSDLLPSLNIPDLSEEVTSFGLRYPLATGSDIALGYSRHLLDFGKSTLQADESSPVTTYHAEESVHHVVLSGRWAGIASVGIGWKWLDSRLGPAHIQLDTTAWRGTASASTWDLGVLVSPRWTIPRTPVEWGPSVGASWINVAEDSIDYGDGYPDPVFRVLRFGAAGEMSYPDLLDLQLFVDQEIDLNDTARLSSLQYRGWSMEALGIYRYSSADLYDPAGQRFETQASSEYIFDLKHLWRLKWRLQHGDYTNSIDDLPDDFPLPSFRFLGATLTPNIRFSWTESTIRAHGTNTARQGQKRLGWSISL